MPSPNWLNENRNRAFPFLKNSVGVETPSTGVVTMRQLPNEWIVDVGFTVGLESGFGYELSGDEYVAAAHTIYLHRIYREGTTVYFEFASDAPALYGKLLTFQRDLSDPLYTVEHMDIDDATSQSFYGCEPFLWAGYLVTGDLSTLAGHLADGAEILHGTGDAVVEPALILNLDRSFLNDVSVGNNDRTRATASLDCDPLVWDYDTGIIFVNARCLQGRLYWMPGYNCEITQDNVANSLTIAAIVGRGAGQPCAEVALFPEELPPTGSLNSLLSGGPLCNETLRSINGIGGPLLSFLAGSGVSIIPDPVNNKITIDVNMIGLATCYNALSEISENV